jgi:hypothetical protein
MLRIVLLALVALVAIGGLRGEPACADQSSSTPAFDFIAHSWIGKWACTETKSGQPIERWAETMTLYGTKWLMLTGTYPADKSRPATEYESVLGYDDDLHQWATVTFLANGSYGIDRSASPASSLTQVWVNAYPIDPKSNPPVTLVMTKNRYTVDGNYTDNGRRISFHWDCRKHLH